MDEIIGTGVNAADVSEPSTDSGTNDIAASQLESVPDTPETDEGDTAPTADAPPETETKKTQNAEENAAFAAARRKAEAEYQKKLETEVARAADEAVKALGLMNPYTNTPIVNREQHDAYIAEKARRDAAEKLKGSKLTEDDLKRLVEAQPEVLEARRLKDELSGQLKKVQLEAARARSEEQLKELGEIDPAIKSFEDLMAHESYGAVRTMVAERGLSLAEAYKLVNFDKLTKMQTEAAAQAVRNGAQSKAHLTATKPAGNALAPVPADVMREYKAMNPGMTDAEIQRHYNKFYKLGGN